MNSSNQHFWGTASRLSRKRVLGGLNILRHFGLDLQNVLPLHFRRNRISAFTLSEVLITLGIVGVVAVLLLAIVIPQIQDRQYAAAWKKEYSIISNVFQSAITENIPICKEYNASGTCNVLVGFSDEFWEHFYNNVKIVDSCSQAAENRCDNFNYPTSWQQARAKYKWSGMASNHSRYRALGVRTESNPGTYSPYGVLAYNFNSRAFLLNDGAVVYFGGTHGGPWIAIDVNNFNKGPNEIGRDFFIIRISSNIKTGVHWAKPLGADGTYNKTINGDTCLCNKDVGTKTMNYFAGAAGNGEIVSGGCCSYTKLYDK